MIRNLIYALQIKIADKLGSLVNNVRSLVELLLTKSLNPATPPFATLPPAMFGKGVVILYVLAPYSAPCYKVN